MVLERGRGCAGRAGAGGGRRDGLRGSRGSGLSEATNQS